MKISKQTLLGTGVLLGGSVLLYVTTHQILHAQPKNAPEKPPMLASSTPKSSPDTPLTVDIHTEKQLLEQKQKEREARVRAQEQAAQQYMTQQQQIAAQALARSRAENQLYNQPTPASAVQSNVIVQPVVKPRPTTETEVTSAPNSLINTTTKTTASKDVPQTTVATARNNPSQNQPTTTSQQPTNKATGKTNPDNQQKIERKAEQKNEQKNEQKAEQKIAPKPAIAAQRKVTEPKAVQPKITKPKADAETTTQSVSARPSRYQVAKGEGLIALSQRYNVPVDILAEANGLNKTTPLRIGQTLTIPTTGDVNRLQKAAERKEQQRQQEIERTKQQAAQKEQQQRQYEAAQDKLKQARQTVKQTDAKGNFGVQVALASDEQKAEEITKKLQAAGYRVKTSPTSRGVRVVVGPETGKLAALALKDKLNSDPRLGMSNAWVLYW